MAHISWVHYFEDRPAVSEVQSNNNISMLTIIKKDVNN